MKKDPANTSNTVHSESIDTKDKEATKYNLQNLSQLAVLEEILEERVGPDRRVSTVEVATSEDRRKIKRRESGLTK